MNSLVKFNAITVLFKYEDLINDMIFPLANPTLEESLINVS
ncbi:hypothetical protein O53_3414 [Microcystis aeruginosa TAIHU98]|uniref:Uncharacterized protein n=1 Tax=Microcystis aeruginosa TAIHU98 TaxID=1134457 RepID=L7E6X1_MICAE|nr:hypothetical protein O53_3414 [Microcystis aeruginosa TAIHU98]